MQFCLNESILEATWDRGHVRGTFSAMSLFAKSTGAAQPQNTHSPNVKDAQHERQSSSQKAANSFGRSHPLLQAAGFPNQRGAAGAERISHGSCVSHGSQRSISFSVGAKGGRKLQLIRRKGGKGRRNPRPCQELCKQTSLRCCG